MTPTLTKPTDNAAADAAGEPRGARRWLRPWMLLAVAPAVLAGCLALGPAGLGIPSPTDPLGRAVFALRLNRVLAGFMVGAALASSGAVLQALLRNPLAEPYVLGVSSGAGLGAALSILCGAAAASAVATPLLAFGGALATLALVQALARDGGGWSPHSLILSGVIVSSVCASVLMFLVSLAPVEGLHSILWWMLGNLEVASGGVFAACAALTAAAYAVSRLLARELNALTLGEPLAHHVGVRTRAATGLGLAAATLAAAAAVALAGLIGFVGLIVPHAVRRLAGPDHERLLPCAALAGGLFLALCDAVARTALAPVEIPVGVVTALIGGPCFVAILRRRRAAPALEA